LWLRYHSDGGYRSQRRELWDTFSSQSYGYCYTLLTKKILYGHGLYAPMAGPSSAFDTWRKQISKHLTTRSPISVTKSLLQQSLWMLLRFSCRRSGNPPRRRPSPPQNHWRSSHPLRRCSSSPAEPLALQPPSSTSLLAAPLSTDCVNCLPRRPWSI
jgi:hypothetical protein